MNYFRFIRQCIFGSSDHKLQSSSSIFIRIFIPEALSNSHTYLYADDTIIFDLAFINITTLRKLKNVLNKELAIVYLAELNIAYDKNRITRFPIAEYLVV